MAELMKKGMQQAMAKLAKDSANAMTLMMDLPWNGMRVGDAAEYKAAKALLVDMYLVMERAARRTRQYPVQTLMGFHDSDYQISLYQAMDVAGLFNQASAAMHPALKAWFIAAFYGNQYEFASKQLIAFANAVTGEKYDWSGKAFKDLVNEYKLTGLAAYFDPFLRNAIDHSQYIVQDLEGRTIEAWNLRNGVKTEKRVYNVVDIFNMTVGLIFFTIAYHNQWYELVIYCNQQGLIFRPSL